MDPPGYSVLPFPYTHTQQKGNSLKELGTCQSQPGAIDFLLERKKLIHGNQRAATSKCHKTITVFDMLGPASITTATVLG